MFDFYLRVRSDPSDSFSKISSNLKEQFSVQRLVQKDRHVTGGMPNSA